MSAYGRPGLYLVSQPLPLEVLEPRPPRDCAYGVDGDVLGCGDQTLGQVVGVEGTPYTLHYQSERTPGGRAVEIALTGETIPAGATALEVTVRVAGRELVERFAPEPSLSVLFAWDGRDADGQIALGVQLATIEVVEIHPVGGVEYRWNARLWGGLLGGWSVKVHHFFDPLARILYLGSGGQRAGAALGYVQETDQDTVLLAADKGPAVYEFDRTTGVHLRTLNALTGATAVSFGESPWFRRRLNYMSPAPMAGLS